MPGVCHRSLLSAVAVALLLFSGTGSTTITTAPQVTDNPAVATTCEFRTINYITDTLPQLCLKSSWSNANGTSATSTLFAEPTVTGGEIIESLLGSGSAGGGTNSQTIPTEDSVSAAHTSAISTSQTTSNTAEASVADLEPGELNDSSFLSFEEWKKRTLEKAGQADANIGKKRSGEGKKRDSESFQNHLDSLGEEGEIDIDIGFGGGGREDGKREGSQRLEAGESDINQNSGEEGRGGKGRDHYRSKDAGKTCKERFSYASFDAGATILKTHRGAKNSKAVLIENKDSYMLSECSTENKFIIVELSEDIWIDTVVLANYEFFSSMIRTFRVSVSDRYPVKIEKWKDVGTFEARNSRDIQAFLIENPQIWARYIRIEFLSHYGNEYYCPLSLVRVHGTRMLESWKESEASAEDEENDDSESGHEDEFIHDAVAESVQAEERLSAELKDTQTQSKQATTPKEVENAVGSSNLPGNVDETAMTSPWERKKIISYFRLANTTQLKDICLLSEAPIEQATSRSTISEEKALPYVSIEGSDLSTITESPVTSTTSTTSTATQGDKPTIINTLAQTNISTVSAASEKVNTRSDTPTSTTKAQNGTNSIKNKTSSTSSASSSLPTIQESFFKAVSRRLNFLESNSTLSLKYIEEQSRILREAFTRVEKKQLQKTAVFLETLNSTVLDELRGFRQQYDEIWQSTVISLESQREASRKEFLAISSRLNILADEVVFQKRMSIVQSVLLLLCLGLVIFSRVSGNGHLDIPYLQGRAKTTSGYSLGSPIESPLYSPSYHRQHSLTDGRWLEVNHNRQRSDEIAMSHSQSRDHSPATPVSTYSQSEGAGLTPPSGPDELSGDIPVHLLVSPKASDMPLEEQPRPSQISSYRSIISSKREDIHASPASTLSPSPNGRKPLVRQQSVPPQHEGRGWPLKSDPTTFSSPFTHQLSGQQRDIFGMDFGHREPGGAQDVAITEEGGEEGVAGDNAEALSIPTIHLPSPPPENGDSDRKSSLSIVRKPLPALPPGSA